MPKAANQEQIQTNDHINTLQLILLVCLSYSSSRKVLFGVIYNL